MKSDIRKRAEQFVQAKNLPSNINVSPEEIQVLIHEYQVHQVELEIQNEELCALQLDLETSKQRYFDFFNLAPVGYIVVDPDFVILDTNLYISKLFGKSKSMLKGKLITNYILSSDQDIFYLFKKQLHENRHQQTCEIQLLGPDQKPFWARLDSNLDEIGNSNDSQIMIIVRDISIIRDAQIKTIKSEFYLRSVIESTADGILVIDNKGKVVTKNSQFDKKWSIPKAICESHDDKQLLDFVLDQLINPQEFLDKVNMLYRTNDTILDFIYFKDHRIFERFSSPLLINNQNEGRIWSFRDVTDRKNADTEIQNKNEQLKLVNAEKDKFFSILAHDLRSPFNTLLGFSEILTDELDSMTLKEIKTIAERLKNAATNVFSLLENLLEWSNLERGLTRFNPVSFNLMPEVLDCLTSTSDTAKNKEVSIHINIAEEICVYGNKNMLKSIIRNLVNNAIKFCYKNGEIDIAAKVMEGGIIELSVRDSGIGMSKEICDNLFRIDINTNRKGTEGESSTGLGLVICKDMVERQGGTIWTESEEGHGSTFFFTLPYQI